MHETLAGNANDLFLMVRICNVQILSLQRSSYCYWTHSYTFCIYCSFQHTVPFSASNALLSFGKCPTSLSSRCRAFGGERLLVENVRLDVCKQSLVEITQKADAIPPSAPTQRYIHMR